MSGFKFYKYKAQGSDFLLIDDRANRFPRREEMIKSMCERHAGIGAQGLVCINNDPTYDFSMDFYTIQGKPGSLCTMAMLCAVQFTIDKKITLKAEICFKSQHGIHSAKFYDDQNAIRIKLNDIDTITKLDEVNYYIDTGVPHHIQFRQNTNIYGLDLHKESLASKGYEPYADLISFVHQEERHEIHVRTYNRKLEFESISCGTSAVAAAIALAFKKKRFSSQKPNKKIKRVVSRGGEMAVTYNQTGDVEFTDITVVGKAQVVFEGNYVYGLNDFVMISM